MIEEEEEEEDERRRREREDERRVEGGAVNLATLSSSIRLASTVAAESLSSPSIPLILRR